MTLVNTPELRALYNDAKDKPEHATKRFWGYVLQQKFFKGPEWNLSSEQPPTQELGDLRRMDQFLEHFSHAKWRGIMLIEEKRASAGVRDVQEVESQAFTASCAYLHWNREREVFVMTAFGPNARIWFYKAGETYLTPYVPNTDGLSAKDEYIDADTAEAAALIRGFEFIFKNRTPSKIRNSPPSSPRPATLILPSNWHFDEVALIAGTSKLPSKDQGHDIDRQYDDEDEYDDDPQPFQTNIPSGYGAMASRSIPAPYSAMYSAPSGATAGQYMYSVAPPTVPGARLGFVAQAGPRTQTSKGGDELFNEEDPEKEDSQDDGDDGDSQMGGVAKTQATSSKELKQVSVSKKSHLTRKDEYIFKDTNGKTRTTEKDNWKKIKHKGRTAWKYHHYYTYDFPM